jgi:hypothetical protein
MEESDLYVRGLGKINGSACIVCGVEPSGVNKEGHLLPRFACIIGAKKDMIFTPPWIMNGAGSFKRLANV